MMNFLNKIKQIFKQEPTPYEQLHVNAENEYQAMSCGAFNPKFLARIRKSKADNNKIKNKKKE